MTTYPILPTFRPGFQLIDGSTLNLMIYVITLLEQNTGTGGGFGQGRIVTDTGDISLLASDGIVEVAQNTPGAIAINLPSNPTTWQPYTIVDGAGVFGVYNATVTPSSGTINGQPTFIMSNNWQSDTFYWNGTNWRVLV